ncbi:MAG: hypothetical protein JWP59_1684 [Massilia sp.]|jgi:hypothetical protein|nr:hypothetical protein [Massilia sp.]
MKRLIVIVLMLLLPLQIAWAGMDRAWPAPQQSVAADKSTHHAHEYLQSADQAGDDLAASATPCGDDPDCDYCHHSVSSILFLSFHFDCAGGRLDPPSAGTTHFISFIPDISHPPDIRAV